MSTKKKINAGDALTAGDLTDDHLGAIIEVGPIEGLRTRLTLDRVEEAYADVLRLFTPDGGYKPVRVSRPVTVITPPPVVQPDAPTILGQCIRIEGDDEFRGVVADPDSALPIMDHHANWRSWVAVLSRAGDRQIIVSDPPRWPDDEDDSPKAGDTFDRIEDMPYGWIAKVTLSNGREWGHVVRHDEEAALHRWDTLGIRADQEIRDWTVFNGDSMSGNEGGGNLYTLVELAEDHDARVRSERAASERFEEDEL